MSLFGTSPTDDNRPSTGLASPSKNLGSRAGLFDDEPSQRSSSAGLFDNDGDTGADSPWSMPSPRKQQSRAQIVRNLLPASDVPEAYIETFDIISEGNPNVTSDGVAKVFAAARLHEQAKQSRIVSLVAPDAEGDSISLNRAEFNVLLALVGLAQENEHLSLDGVDERRRSELLDLYHFLSPLFLFIADCIFISFCLPLQCFSPLLICLLIGACYQAACN
jgi:sorting nexin-8